MKNQKNTHIHKQMGGGGGGGGKNKDPLYLRLKPIDICTVHLPPTWLGKHNTHIPDLTSSLIKFNKNMAFWAQYNMHTCLRSLDFLS